MKKFLLSILSVVILVTVTGCSNEEFSYTTYEEDQAMILFSKPVTISSENVTKAAIEGTALPAGGTLGVFASKTADSSPYIVNNTLTAYDGGTNSAFAASPNVYYWPGIESLTFHTYFYKGSGVTVTDINTIAYTLQSTWNNQVDLLYSTPITQAKTSTPANTVDLEFNHAMAWVRFNIKSLTNKGAVLSAVKFNDYTTANFSLVSASFSNHDNQADITVSGSTAADATTGDASATDFVSSLVFPTTTSWAKAITVTINGAEFAPVTLAGNQLATLEAGKVYTYTINYTGDAIVFSDPVVKAWQTGSITTPEIPVQ